jgi:hypothetical protein
MWKVNVVLVAAATNENFAPNLSILLDKSGRIPVRDLLKGENSLSIAQSMVSEYTGLTPNWFGATPIQKGVFEPGDEIYVVYYLLLPQEIKRENVRWAKLDNLPIDDFTQDIIRYAIL